MNDERGLERITPLLDIVSQCTVPTYAESYNMMTYVRYEFRPCNVAAAAVEECNLTETDSRIAWHLRYCSQIG